MAQDRTHAGKARIGRGLWAPAVLFFLTVGVGGGTLVAYLWDAKNRLQDEAMIQNARIYAESLRIIQDYYATEILPGIDPELVTIAHDFRRQDNALPFPATLTIDFSQHLTRIDAGFAAAMLSDYPFPWRGDRLLTDFDQRALADVTGTGREFLEFTEENGRRVLHYASPIRMQASCVACHNSHPQSPRTDWKLGDVRGIHVVELPVTPLVSGMQVQFAYLIAWTAVAAALSGAIIALLSSRESRVLDLLRFRNQELVTANAEKDKANQAKAEFLANISHEVRTPMNGILGLVDLMIQDPSAARTQGRLQRLQITGQSLLHIINDVLDFSKIDAGKMTFETIAFDLEQVLDSATGLYDIEPEDRARPRLYVDVDPALPHRVIGDPFRVTQILTNLLSNAFKFTETGHIILAVKPDPEDSGRYCFSVTDTGPGIAHDLQSQLFQPFSQAEHSTSRRFGGTGLGLAISGSLAQGMGGSIALQSTPGQGATFTLTLPLVPADEDEPAVALPDWLKRVYLYDEDPIRRDVQIRLFQSLSAAVETVDRPEDLTRRLPVVGPDAVILINLEQHHASALWTACASPQSPQVLGLYPPGVEAAQIAADALTRPVLAHKLLDRLAQITPGGAPIDGAPILAGPRKPRKAAELPALPRLHVLIVDDNELNRMIAQAFLEQGGVTTQIAASGQQAIEATLHEHFDLVLMDIQMPGMDGYETARRIRSRQPDLKIIALTANAQPQDRQRSRTEGFADHLVKPLSRPALYKALADLPPPPATGQPGIGHRPLIDALEAQGVDTRAGQSFAGDDADLYDTVLQSFARDGSDLTKALYGALAKGDTDATVRTLHTMKSLLNLIGAVQLGRDAGALEQAFKDGTPAGNAELARLSSKFDDLRRLVRRHMTAAADRTTTSRDEDTAR